MKTKTKKRKIKSPVTLEYNPLSEHQTYRVWAKFAVGLVYQMNDADAPFDVLVQVRPTAKASKCKKTATKPARKEGAK